MKNSVQDSIQNVNIDGVDASYKNVIHCQQLNCYRRVWQQVMPSPLLKKWDTVAAFGILEYIKSKDVEEMVSELEKVAEKRVIFSTPNGQYYKGDGEMIVGHNSHHPLNFVSPMFFHQRGYKLLSSDTEMVATSEAEAESLMPISSFFFAYKDIG